MNARLRALLVAETALCALLVSAQSVQPGRLIDNGGFDSGFTGWEVVETHSVSGSGFASAGAFLEDSPHDLGASPAAVLYMSVYGAWDFISSTSQARVSLRHPGIVTGRFLQFLTSADYGVSTTGKAYSEFRAEVVVRGTGPALGIEASLVLAASMSQSSIACPGGLAGDAMVPFARRSIDLASAGFLFGDPVEIEISWGGKVIANEDCEDADVGGQFLFDGFAFRDQTAARPGAQMQRTATR